jgi:protein tyrosine/serine phosphatase
VASGTMPLQAAPRAWRRPVLWGLLVLALVPGWRLYHILLAGNFHVVDESRCYRAAQPTAAELTAMVRRYGIRTVINLRGISDDEEWYPLEVKVAKDLGIELVDVGMWSNSPPEIQEFRNLIHALADGKEPLLIHCNSGSDRTGLGSALYLLLRTDATLPQARQQLGLYYGHIPYSRASCQDRVLDCYENWLSNNNQRHTPELLRRWGLDVYDGRLD